MNIAKAQLWTKDVGSISNVSQIQHCRSGSWVPGWFDFETVDRGGWNFVDARAPFNVHWKSIASSWSHRSFVSEPFL